MQYNKYILLFFSSVIITTASQARPLPDNVGICYEFKAEEMVSRNVCIITDGNAAGGMYTNLQMMSGKQHQIASYSLVGINDGTYDLDGNNAVHYIRDASFYGIIDYEQLAEFDEPVLYCYKSKNLDICRN